MEVNKIIQGDCLEIMKDIPDKSIDMILCDLPYGTTACKWDTIIPFEPLWEQYKRIIKNNGAVVLTASQPFTSALVMSNPDMFRYCLVWDKKCGSASMLLAKKRPLKSHEDVLIFYKNQSIYNPQMTYKKEIRPIPKDNISRITNQKTKNNDIEHNFSNKKYPVSILSYGMNEKEMNSRYRIHPTQKPVALFEYLIKTYTNKGDLVLDNCAGSGTTGVACKNLNRNYILIEKEPEYIKIAEKRLKEVSLHPIEALPVIN